MMCPATYQVPNFDVFAFHSILRREREVVPISSLSPPHTKVCLPFLSFPFVSPTMTLLDYLPFFLSFSSSSTHDKDDGFL